MHTNDQHESSSRISAQNSCHRNLLSASDFRLLGISKIGGFYQVSQGRPDRIRLSHFIQSISTAGPNMLVVKTESGGASPVAEAVDHAVLFGIVGTVAGDNTIFIATENSDAHEPIKQFLGNI